MELRSYCTVVVLGSVLAASVNYVEPAPSFELSQGPCIGKKL
jgi:hypothetical protein